MRLFCQLLLLPYLACCIMTLVLFVRNMLPHGMTELFMVSHSAIVVGLLSIVYLRSFKSVAGLFARLSMALGIIGIAYGYLGYFYLEVYGLAYFASACIALGAAGGVLGKKRRLRESVLRTILQGPWQAYEKGNNSDCDSWSAWGRIPLGKRFL
ncbi:MAG: hypothetical protein R3C24_12290 [Cyanobacteriota/Melainabacteria group bacterium]